MHSDVIGKQQQTAVTVTIAPKDVIVYSSSSRTSYNRGYDTYNSRVIWCHLRGTNTHRHDAPAILHNRHVKTTRDEPALN